METQPTTNLPELTEDIAKRAEDMAIGHMCECGAYDWLAEEVVQRPKGPAVLLRCDDCLEQSLIVSLGGAQ